MSDDGYELSGAYLDDIDDALDKIGQLDPFGTRTPEVINVPNNDGPLRGYLLQGVSRGGYAMCALVERDNSYRSYKIDLAGIIYEGGETESKFQLRFYKKNEDGNIVTWFDTEELLVDGLTAFALGQAIVDASEGQIQLELMKGALGHPYRSTQLIINDELYPAPNADRVTGELESKMGSWIFCIHRVLCPDGFDVDLLFSTSSSNPVQLVGPAVMTLYEIADVPTLLCIPVCDVMDVASPTPLRGGTKVLLNYFSDVGYGIIAANPREYLFTQRVTNP